ncbi:hypothetical protein [Bacillus sp. V5-8f]|uniref:hypothetical protein n=1 Tax=Bacillus sp. V5-8f TaxID=2053044 RepID=UPI0015E0FBDC|nr:hypothetical protein [Bacillus sp. V5-8f]
MLKRLLSFSNPLGIAFTAAAIILTVSPEARKGTRKMLVKGAGALLSVGDQVKMLTLGARKELGTFVDEAKVEKEQMALPDFSEMMKNVGQNTKTKMNSVFDDMKFPVEKPLSGLSHAMETSEEFMDHNFRELNDDLTNGTVTKKPAKKVAVKKKNIHVQHNAPNVLSDQAFNTLISKPTIE